MIDLQGQQFDELYKIACGVLKSFVGRDLTRDEKLDVWLRARELIREMNCQCPAR